jgi:MHS family proline/betaine transporter-like MFS transporter
MPSFFNKKLGLDTSLTLWMVLTCMVVFTFVVPIAGWLSDKGMPRVKASLGVFVIAGGVAIPMFLAFQTKSLVACWLLQCFSLMMTAFTMGLLPCICASIYPAGVRISGFNLGYNLGMTIFGGCTPLIITAIQSSGANMIFYGPGIWLLCMAVTSIICSVALLKWYPETNITTVELENNAAPSSSSVQKKKGTEEAAV